MQRREPLFEAYWTFAAGRQQIFERRLEGLPAPWTDDPILASYRFTNAWRASDRVTQFLIRDVIYSHPDLPVEDLVARIVLARLFSKPSTWHAIEAVFGTFTSETLRDERLPAVLDELRDTGPIYTSAFILCATNAYGYPRKHLNHLALVRDMLDTGLPRSIAAAQELKDVYEALKRFPLIGPFMAYQIAIDLNYSELTDFSENDFTVPGPGAERGIRKVFPDATSRDMPMIIHEMVQTQESACLELGIEPPTLFGRPLHAIDCQNLFCELDKYARVRFPDLPSNRNRIKAKFTPVAEPLELFYPPKWGINERLPAQLQLFAAA